MSEHIETRKKVKEIADISSFHNLVNQLTLSDTDKDILELHYIHSNRDTVMAKTHSDISND